MLTLKEVKKAVAPAKLQKRVPSPQMLEDESKVFVTQKINEDSFISVYENGYVLYQVEARKAVFSLHGCGSYCYEAVTGSDVVEGSYFEEQAWYIRLLMEGEDLLERNQTKRASNYKQISYSQFAEDRECLMAAGGDIELEFIRKEVLEEIDSLLNDKQRFALYSYYVDQMTQQEIAELMGIKQQWVCKMIKLSLFKLRQHLDPEWISRLVTEKNI